MIKAFFLPVACFLALTQDEIIVTSSLRDVVLQASCERLGTYSAAIDGDYFAQASPENPIYLRIQFADEGIRLCQTLVDLEGSDTGHAPIQVALSVLNFQSEAELVAPADSIQIVRWRAGESSIWLKVQRSSSSWTRIGETLAGPSALNQVFFILGWDEDEWRNFRDTFGEERSLPWNQLSDGTLASTAFRIDSSAKASVDGSPEIPLSSRNFDSSTSGVESEAAIVLGMELATPRWSPGVIVGRWVTARAFQHRFVLPWVSWNPSYQSEISLANTGSAPVSLSLTARRGDGTQAVAQLQLGAWHSRRFSAGELFPELGEGSGFCLEILANEPHLSAGLTTFLRDAASGHSPALADAISSSSNQALSRERGEALTLSNFPNGENFFTGLVVVNLGEQNTTAELILLDEMGARIGAAIPVPDLLPLQPRALLIRDLVPEGTRPSRALITARGADLCALGFSFDESREPGMVTAQRFSWPIPALQPK